MRELDADQFGQQFAGEVRRRPVARRGERPLVSAASSGRRLGPGTSLTPMFGSTSSTFGRSNQRLADGRPARLAPGAPVHHDGATTEPRWLLKVRCCSVVDRIRSSAPLTASSMHGSRAPLLARRWPPLAWKLLLVTRKRLLIGPTVAIDGRPRGSIARTVTAPDADRSCSPAEHESTVTALGNRSPRCPN